MLIAKLYYTDTIYQDLKLHFHFLLLYIGAGIRENPIDIRHSEPTEVPDEPPIIQPKEMAPTGSGNAEVTTTGVADPAVDATPMLKQARNDWIRRDLQLRLVVNPPREVT